MVRRSAKQSIGATKKGDDLNNNQWSLIRKFYKSVTPLILKSKSTEWAVDPYAWEQAEIKLTPIESWLWHDIRALDAVFYPQYPVDNFFIDFANPVAKVAIECDGKDFHLDKERDSVRDAVLQRLGWSVYRITGKDCRTDYIEDTREKSAAFGFVENICKSHKVSGITS